MIRQKHAPRPARARRPRRAEGDSPMQRLWRRLGRRTRALLAVVCSVAVLVLALGAPALLFAVTDELRFARPTDAGTSYQSRTVDGEDIYLVRQLKDREQAQINSFIAMATSQDTTQALYLPAVTDDISRMQSSPQLCTQCANLLQSLADLEILDSAWLNEMQFMVTQNPEGIYGSSDSMGFLTICYFPSGDVGLQQMSMTIESRTGKMVSLQLSLTGSGRPAPNAEALLRGWVQLNDLDILGDWTVPTGTRWESTGLYSARGGLLATCISCPLSTGFDILSLELTPCSPQQYQAGALPSAGTESGISNEQLYTGQMEYLNANRFNTGSELYVPVTVQDDGGRYLTQVVCLDFAHQIVQPVCRVDGCSHNTTACPACLGYVDDIANVSLYATGGNVYAMVTPGGDAPTRVLELTGGGVSQRVAAELAEDTVTFLAATGSTVYLQRQSRAELNDNLPSPLAALDLTTGQCIDTGALLAPQRRVVGCCGSCLLVADTVNGNPPGSHNLFSTNFAELDEALSVQSTLQLELLDPATGGWRLAAPLTGNLGFFVQRYSASEWLVFSQIYDLSWLTYRQPVQVVNPRTGTVDVLPYDLTASQCCALSDLASSQGPFPAELYLSHVSEYFGTEGDLLYVPGPDEIYELLPAPSQEGWTPIAVTNTGELVFSRGDTLGGAFGIARLEDLAGIGVDAIRPFT